MSAANFTAAIFPTRETTFCRIQPTTTVIGVAELKWCATHHEFYCSPLLSGCEWVTAPKAAP